jgi:energy-converting hydrogenase Eha subunit C
MLFVVTFILCIVAVLGGVGVGIGGVYVDKVYAFLSLLQALILLLAALGFLKV